MGLLQDVDQLTELAELVRLLEAGDALGIDPVDRRQRGAALRRERGPGHREVVVAQDATGDGLAVDPAGHGPGPAQAVALAVTRGHDVGHGHAFGRRGPDQVGFGGHAATGPDAPRPFPLQDELGAVEREGPGLPGRATGEALQIRHRPPEHRLERGGQVRGRQRPSPGRG